MRSPASLHGAIPLRGSLALRSGPLVPERHESLVLPHGGNRRYSIRTRKEAWIGSCLNEKGLIKGNERGESACGAINGNPGTGITDTGRPSGGNARLAKTGTSGQSLGLA